MIACTLLLVALGGIVPAAWWYGRKRLRRELYDAPQDDWRQHCELAFLDKDGRAYYRYRDEMKIPISRFERAQLILREIGNRVSDQDIGVFLDTTEEMLVGPLPDRKKLKDIAANVAMFKARVQLLAPPDLYWQLVACWYIREDQDPEGWDSAFERAKVEQLQTDNEGDVHGFFLRAGLDKFLPSAEGLEKGVNELLTEAQAAADKWRTSQKEVREATA